SLIRFTRSFDARPAARRPANSAVLAAPGSNRPDRQRRGRARRVTVIIAAPLILIVATLIKLESSGPALFVQECIGLYGKYMNLVGPPAHPVSNYDLFSKKIPCAATCGLVSLAGHSSETAMPTASRKRRRRCGTIFTTSRTGRSG